METRLAIPLKNYGKRQSPNPEIHRFALSVCLFVCLCPIKVMTAEPIFFVATHMTQRDGLLMN